MKTEIIKTALSGDDITSVKRSRTEENKWMYLNVLDMYAAVVCALEGKDCREVMKSIADNSSIPQERLSHIVAGMYRILTEAIRIPTSLLKQEVGDHF